MKRKFVEEYIDRWITGIESLQDFKNILSALEIRQNKIFYDRESGTLTKKEWKCEYQCIQHLRKRIDLIIPLVIDQSIEEHQYLNLPVHERCDIVKYRYLARFKINALNITKIRGFSQLEVVGWYNSQHNPNGLVKDHMLSIAHGFKNKINPEVVGHLANCELIPAVKNIKKSSDCSISEKDLKTLIKRWK